MENKNIVSSISFLEFVNNINTLINRLLYSSSEGYTNLKSKNAIVGFCDVVKKFDNEAIKLSKDLDYSEVETLINSKRKDLILQIQKHYNQEVLVWADEVFDNLVENCLFAVSINKNKAKEYYSQLVKSIRWICDVKGLPKEPLPIAIALQPVLKRAFALSISTTSPLPITGMLTASTTSLITS